MTFLSMFVTNGTATVSLMMFAITTVLFVAFLPLVLTLFLWKFNNILQLMTLIINFNLYLSLLSILQPILPSMLFLQEEDEDVVQEGEEESNTTLHQHNVVLLVTIIMMMQSIHLQLLWKSTCYLATCRLLVLPIRKYIMMPLLMLILQLECINAAGITPYLDLSLLKDETMQNKKKQKDINRRYKEMKQLYQKHSISHVWHRSDWSLNLSQLVPIVWDHEQRICNQYNNNNNNNNNNDCNEIDKNSKDGSSNNNKKIKNNIEKKRKDPIEEFIKRILVMTCTSNGILDYYYNSNNQLISIHLSIQQGNVLLCFMYFTKTLFSKNGIWFHGVYTAIERSKQMYPKIQYCNGMYSQIQSKRNAGLIHQLHPNDKKLCSKLYPIYSIPKNIPTTILNSINVFHEKKNETTARRRRTIIQINNKKNKCKLWNISET